MDHQPETFGLLHKTIGWLSENKLFHICIHDTSGMLHNCPECALPLNSCVHFSHLCNTAKTTAAGLRFCMRCKACSIKKASQLKELYAGSCYLGITEIIKPVFFQHKLACIIYVGNLILADQREQILCQIKKACKITGIQPDVLIKAMDTVEPVNIQALEKYKELANMLARYISLMLLDNISNKGKSVGKPEVPVSRHWIIQSVENHILAYYNRDLKLSHLAKLYSIHPHYLCKLFKKEMGTGFSDYVNRIRIKNAKKLLSSNEQSIINISLEVGFNNVTYFNKIFKKHTGMTPGNYRTMIKAYETF